jgi:hypothetical protein
MQLNKNIMEDKDKLNELPNPRVHQTVSFMKSFIRLGACALLGCGFLTLAAIAFGIAEVFGIVEEIF